MLEKPHSSEPACPAFTELTNSRTANRRRQWHPTPVLLPGKSHGWRSLVGYSSGVTKSRTQLSDFTLTFHFHALEKEMATHSSVLAWRIPGTGECGGLPSLGSHRVWHDWSNLAAAAGQQTTRSLESFMRIPLDNYVKDFTKTSTLSYHIDTVGVQRSQPKERPERISKVSAKKAYFSQSFYFLVLLEGDIQYVWCKGIRNGVKRGVREGNGTPLKYSCLGNPMDRGAW